MEIEQRTPENTAIVLIDYVVGFANLFRSQSVVDNINGGVALAKMALGYGIPVIATVGPKNDPRGGLYPQIGEVLEERHLVHKGGQFDAFDDPAFEAAVRKMERRHLVVAGLMTEGCVLQTTLGALRRDFTVSIVVDATAGESSVTHDAAIMRMMQHGVTPTTWQSFGSEILRTWEDVEKAKVFRQVRAQSPGLGMSLLATAAAQAAVTAR
ncbi:isochorismatase family protein [Caulobacter soli]|uniref:isochorismatase family protein n=1 Tax=Caulobacter soli TaxID=2708539 RepID=UPI0013EAA993|nr:isochorismatase family protein [Caulobacter soli]